MTDEVVENTEDSVTEDTDTEVTENAESGEAEEAADTQVEKDEGDAEGEDDSGDVVEYSADDFELPEGMEVDEAMMNEFLEIANNKELSGKDRDQALVSLYAKKQQEAVESQYKEWDDKRKGWQADFKADKEFGGKAFDESKASSLKALAHYGSKELKEFAEQYGWVDHPEVMKFLTRIGKTLSEDSSAQGKGEGQTSIEERWYGGASGQ